MPEPRLTGQRNYRMEPDVLRLLAALKEQTGKTETQIVHEAIREYAERRGLQEVRP